MLTTFDKINRRIVQAKSAVVTHRHMTNAAELAMAAKFELLGRAD